MSDIEDEPLSVLLPCTICSRTFRPEVLDRHVKVCEKTSSKKRRVFDSFKNRVSGTELEEFLGPAPLPGQTQKRFIKSPVKKKVNSKWKETHENLIAVLRAARGVAPPLDRAMEVSKHGSNAGNEQCPSCNRYFGPRAFDRHVEFCKEKTARIKMTPSKVSQAQERLEARTKYRAPLSVKPKLTTKEKYTPILPRKDSTETCSTVTMPLTKTSPPVPALSRNTKTINQTTTKSTLSRSNERQRSVSPNKKSATSNTKSTIKNDHATNKSSNQPKIKENLKDHEILRPKTNTRATSQNKIRSSKLEDETSSKLFNLKKKSREKSIPKFCCPSDNESVATLESESSEIHGKQNSKIKNRWSSSENVSKSRQKVKGKITEEKYSVNNKIFFKPENEGDKEKVKIKNEKTLKKWKKPSKQQTNDLSVNDESETFGIKVAPCYRPSSINNSPKYAQVTHNSPERNKKLTEKEVLKIFNNNLSEESEETVADKTVKNNVGDAQTNLIQDENVRLPDSDSKENKIIVNSAKFMNSAIPKPKKSEVLKPFCEAKNFKPNMYQKVLNDQIEFQSEFENNELEMQPDETTRVETNESLHKLNNRTDNIKKMAKKWQNLSEMSTEDLKHISKDFDIPSDKVSQDLSESAIWDIAAEQFLKCEESIKSVSVTSVDSLNPIKPMAPESFDKKGDDFIVLHVTDPAKLDENDAAMKLSISEPCFSYSGKIQKLKEKADKLKTLNLFVFTSLPTKFQKPIRKRKKQKKVKKPKTVPNLAKIREKTFLANDMPKPKRRKLNYIEVEKQLNLQNSHEVIFETLPLEEFTKKKNKFIEEMMKTSRKVNKWYITGKSHINFMEEFPKSIQDDLRELQNLWKGKKKRRKSYVKEFKKEKYKDLKKQKTGSAHCQSTLNNNSSNSKSSNENVNIKNNNYHYIETLSENETYPNKKKFEYFEINFEDLNLKNDSFANEEKSKHEKELIEPFKESKESLEVTTLNTKKLEYLEISNNLSEKLQLGKKSYETISVAKINIEKDFDYCSDILQENPTTAMSLPSNRTSTPIKILKVSRELNSSSSIFNLDLNQTNYQQVKENLVGSENKVMKSKEFPLNGLSNSSNSEFDGDDLTPVDSLQVFNNPNTNQNSSLENIEEVDEEEENIENEQDDIEIEDFIVSKPNAKKILLKEGNCLDQLFPKPKKILETSSMEESTTAVHLGYTADSLYDLKVDAKNSVNDFRPLSNRRSSRILEKRIPKEMHLPQIKFKNEEKKENSMISLLELWKNKRGTFDGEIVGKIKETLPQGKLAPLSSKNFFQIGTNVNDSYDPFKQAERQMLALMSWPSVTDVKTSKNISPTSPPNQNFNLETSSTSAFSKYKSEKINSKTATKTKKNLNKTIENDNKARKNDNKLEKPTYTSADDWEKIFEKHFDLNQNEMTDQMTKSVKTALDGLLKNSNQNKKSSSDKKNSPSPDKLSPKNQTNFIDNSLISEVLYTSTPKQVFRKRKDATFDLDDPLNGFDGKADLTYDRITPPKDFNDAFGKSRRDDKKNRNSGISLSNLSFCSQISDTTLADEEVLRSNLEVVGKAAAAAIAKSPRRKYARSQSVFDVRNKMLFAQTYDPDLSSSDENDIDLLPVIVDKREKNSPTRCPHPKSVPSHFYRSQSVFEDKCKGDGNHTDEGDHALSPEYHKSRKAKLSGDSAYSSLNRKSPQKIVQEDRLSSSGSDHSIPFATSNERSIKSKPVDTNLSVKKDHPVKMSKFCHECGSKYPVAVAKFCCECGVRRLII